MLFADSESQTLATKIFLWSFSFFATIARNGERPGRFLRIRFAKRFCARDDFGIVEATVSGGRGIANSEKKRRSQRRGDVKIAAYAP